MDMRVCRLPDRKPDILMTKEKIMSGYIVVGIIAAYSAFVLIRKLRALKRGKFCSGGCAGCTGCASCCAFDSAQSAEVKAK